MKTYRKNVQFRRRLNQRRKDWSSRVECKGFICMVEWENCYVPTYLVSNIKKLVSYYYYYYYSTTSYFTRSSSHAPCSCFKSVCLCNAIICWCMYFFQVLSINFLASSKNTYIYISLLLSPYTIKTPRK